MQLDWLKPLTDLDGPFASATLDASTVDPIQREHLLTAWRAARRELEREGADEATLAVLEEAVTDHSHGPGERTQVVCAAHGRLLLDLTFPGRPRQERCSFGPVPRVMGVVRGLDGLQRYAVVRIDREGADIDVVEPTGTIIASVGVAGADDEVRKVSLGGTSQGRFEARAEDSWKHNAAQVAQELDGLVRRVQPEAVLLEGEERMVSHLEAQASGALAERLVRLSTGGRAEGTSEAAAAKARESVLARLRVDRDTRLVERLGDAIGAGTAVQGWSAVMDAAAKAQVAHVVLASEPGTDAADGPPADRDPDALLWALAATGAELSVVGQPLPAAEGIAAILRWTEAPARS